MVSGPFSSTAYAPASSAHQHQQPGRPPPACLHRELHRCVQPPHHAALLLSPPAPARQVSPASSHPRPVAILLERIIVANHPFGHPEHHNTRPGQRDSKRRGAWFPTQTRRVQSAHCPYGVPRRLYRTRRAHPPSADIASTAPMWAARRWHPKMSSPCSRIPATSRSSSAMGGRKCVICCTS